DRDRLPLANLEAHVLERVEIVGTHLLAAHPTDEALLEGVRVALDESLGDAIEDDRWRALGGLRQSVGHYTSWAKVRSARRKVSCPAITSTVPMRIAIRMWVLKFGSNPTHPPSFAAEYGSTV